MKDRDIDRHNKSNLPEGVGEASADSKVMSPGRKSVVPLVVAAVFTAILIIFIKLQKEPVVPHDPAPAPGIDYSSFGRPYVDQAAQRNMIALKTFEMNVNRVLKKADSKFKRARIDACDEASTYNSCTVLVYHMALDKIKKSSETEAYLNQIISPHTDPVMNELADDLCSLVEDLETGLRESTFTLATDLAGIGTAGSNTVVTIDLEGEPSLDLDEALKNLGLNATGNGVAIAFDVAALTPIALRVFGKQAIKATASVGAAAADGPLPVGDIIAIGGLIWTGYDVYAGRKQFEKEINIALTDSLQDAKDNIHKQALDWGTEMTKLYQEKQALLGCQFIAQK